MIEPVGKDRLLGTVSGIDAEDVQLRFAEQNHSYLARIDGVVVGCGWVASRTAEIGELGIALALASTERYLWDFVTLPEWRGRRILKAGFHLTVELPVEFGGSHLLAVGPLDRARAAAALLGIPLVTDNASSIS